MSPNDTPLRYIACSAIRSGNNPRKKFSPAEMEELTASVRQNGVIQAILVRQMEDGIYEIIAGERRWRAAVAGRGVEYEIPCLVTIATDREVRLLAAIENVQRADMTPVEEAEAAADIVGDCNGDRDEAARRLGWDRQKLNKRMALMNATQAVRDALSGDKILQGHAELLASVPKAKQDGILTKLLSMPSMLSVADCKSLLAQAARTMDSAIFDKVDCQSCPHNTGNQQALFAETIADGHCTGGECFDRKTEEVLQSKAVSLKDEWPVVRIVRIGEDKTIIKLVAEGATGVGAEQAEACKACVNFGAAISAIPGRVGNIYQGYCFDVGCNAAKVAARIKADKVTLAAPIDTGATKATAGKAKAASTKTPAQKTEVQDAQRVKDYRVKVWREVFRKELMASQTSSEVVLIALGIHHSAGRINGSAMKKAFERLTGGKPTGTSLDEVCVAVAGAESGTHSTLIKCLAAAAFEDLGEHDLVKVLNFLEADLGKHWQLNADYLDLLTKSEMQVVAVEIGLKASIGDKFTKLFGGKKEEIVKALLAVDGFNYSGQVPVNMKWKN